MLPGESSCLDGSEYVWERGVESFKAVLWPLKVDPYFERKKITLGGVAKTWPAAILTLEPNLPGEVFEMYIKIFSQEDFALKSRLWQAGFLERLPRYFSLS